MFKRIKRMTSWGSAKASQDNLSQVTSQDTAIHVDQRLSQAGHAIRLAIDQNTLKHDTNRSTTLSNYLNTIARHKEGDRGLIKAVYSVPTMCELKFWRESSVSPGATVNHTGPTGLGTELESHLSRIWKHIYPDDSEWTVPEGHHDGPGACRCVIKTHRGKESMNTSRQPSRRDERSHVRKSRLAGTEPEDRESVITRLETFFSSMAGTTAQESAGVLLTWLRDDESAETLREVTAQLDQFVHQTDMAATSVRDFAVPGSSRPRGI